MIIIIIVIKQYIYIYKLGKTTTITAIEMTAKNRRHAVILEILQSIITLISLYITLALSLFYSLSVTVYNFAAPKYSNAQ